MEPGFGPSTYGDSFADVYDDWYGTAAAARDASAAVEFLGSMAGTGPVLELGVGTGRMSLPLAARGLDVRGVDASAQMLRRLRAKPGAAAMRITLGDMAELDLGDDERFSLIFATCNTFLNLASEDAQRRCLERVASKLAPDGRLVIEAFVPDGDAPLCAVETSSADSDHVVLILTQRDPVAQVVVGRHVEIGEGGLRFRPWRIRYLTPAQLDALAETAGLVLAQRCSGWDGAPFSEGDAVHVSVYRAQ